MEQSDPPLNILVRNFTQSRVEYSFDGASEGNGSASDGTLVPCAATGINMLNYETWSFTIDGQAVIDSTDPRLPVFPPQDRREVSVTIDMDADGPRLTGVRLGGLGPGADTQLPCGSPSPST